MPGTVIADIRVLLSRFLFRNSIQAGDCIFDRPCATSRRPAPLIGLEWVLSNWCGVGDCSAVIVAGLRPAWHSFGSEGPLAFKLYVGAVVVGRFRLDAVDPCWSAELKASGGYRGDRRAASFVVRRGQELSAVTVMGLVVRFRLTGGAISVASI